MRLNLYTEELEQFRVAIVTKEAEGRVFVGVRIYTALPVALATPPTRIGGPPGIAHVSGPFVHADGDDDSSGITFWGARVSRKVLQAALAALDEHESSRAVAR